jgi:D-alanyl-D-alanine carboxypeptidase
MSIRASSAVLVAAVVLSGIAAAAVAPPRPAGDTQTIIDMWRRRAAVPAVSVALQTGSSQATYVSGSATPASQFRVASITKMFVAAVVMQLVEEGRLDLDARAGTVAPGLPVGGDRTIRQLLNHTSGLPDYGVPDFSQSLVDQRDRRWTADAVLRTLDGRSDTFTAGTDWQYSNTNYVVLGEVITGVTGRPWHAELRTRILGPLDLNDTYVAGYEPARGTGLVAEAYFDIDNDGVFEDVEAGSWPALETSEGPAGALVSTAADVATFTRALFSGDLVSDTTLRMMVAGSGFPRRFDDYGLGLELRRPDFSTDVWGHGGFLPGYRSTTWHVPEENLTTTILINDSRADPADLAQLLLQRHEP